MKASLSSFKVVLLGEGRVGKTSVALRYVQDSFLDSQKPTLQASYLSKRLTLEGQPVQLAIWDTAGQERFHALGPIYYRDADAALLVYDITDSDTLERVKMWVKELRKMAPAGIELAIAANKIDLDKNGRINLKEAESYAKGIGASFHKTSAKEGVGLEEAFVGIAKRLLEKRKTSSPSVFPTIGPKKSLVIVDSLPQKEQPKSQCCF